jgi:hypothetical protein
VEHREDNGIVEQALDAINGLSDDMVELGGHE